MREKLLLVLIALSLVGEHRLRAADGTDEEVRDAWSAEYLQLAEDLLIVSKSSAAEIKLKKVPLMKWSNPVRGNGTTSGDFFVWTRNDQPVVVGTFFSYVPSTDSTVRNVAMAFHALVAEDFELTLSEKRHTLHGSQLHQIAYELPDSEVAQTTVRRLQQMRTWAKACEATTMLEGRPEPLRLLPQPLLVVGDEESKDKKIVGNECALFAMVTGTDAEVLLLVQAIEATADQKTHWQVTPARFTDLPIEVKVHGKTIWESAGTTRPAPFLSVHGLFLKPLDPRSDATK
jgi:hypothetical protein